MKNTSSVKVDPKFVLEIDLQKLIEDLVWKKFLESLRFSFLRRIFYRRNDHHIEIRWSYFSFEDFLESEVSKPDPSEKAGPDTQYSTTYTCKIGGPQKHIFNAQGSQTESKMINLQKNYSVGGKVSINIAGLEFNVGGEHQSSSESKTDTTTSWSDTTEFTLKENDSAKVVVTQQKGISEKYFVVKTVLRLRPTRIGWGAPVIVRKKSNRKKVFEYEIIGFKELFEAYRDCKDLVEIRPQEDIQEFEGGQKQRYDKVYIFSRGIVKSQKETRSVNVVPRKEY